MKTKIFVNAVIVFLSLTLFACSTVHFRKDEPVPENTYYGTEVSLGPCVFLRKPGESALTGLLSTLGGQLITNTVDWFGKALEISAKGGDGDGKVESSIGRRNVEISKTSLGPCIQLVRGKFFRNPSLVQNPQAAWIDQYFDKSVRFGWLWNNRLWLADTPDFMFEGVIVRSEDDSAFMTIPVYARLDEPMAQPIFRRDKDRFVTLSFQFAEIGVDQDTLTPSFAIPIGRLSSKEPVKFIADRESIISLPGSEQTMLQTSPGDISDDTFDDVNVGNTSTTRSRPGDTPDGLITSGDNDRVVNDNNTNTDDETDTGSLASSPVIPIGLPYESNWFQIQMLSDNPSPRRLSGLIVEIQDANASLQFLSDIINSDTSKKAITDTLSKLILPQTEQEKTTAFENEISNKTNYLKALGELRDSLATCISATEKPGNIAQDVITKLGNIQKAARKAGEKSPVDDDMFDSINLFAPLDGIKQACRSILDTLEARLQ